MPKLSDHLSNDLSDQFLELEAELLFSYVAEPVNLSSVQFSFFFYEVNDHKIKAVSNYHFSCNHSRLS